MLSLYTDARARFALAAVLTVMQASSALAHGWAGERFFPATILTDDPFVADEISLPQVSLQPPAPDASQLTNIEIDLLGALRTMGQYQLFIDGPHQALGLLGLNVTWGHTGRAAVGAPNFTTLSPTFDFGKGFGDIPRSLTFLRPFAITGNLGFDFPTQATTAGVPNPNNFSYGFAFEYSFPYLECCVKDVGLRAPFNQLIPPVEVAFTTPISRAPANQTIGTIQPGIIWAGSYFQIGAEAIIPANRLTGHGYGGVVQLHFYLDDLFPRSIGKPVSEWW